MIAESLACIACCLFGVAGLIGFTWGVLGRLKASTTARVSVASVCGLLVFCASLGPSHTPSTVKVVQIHFVLDSPAQGVYSLTQARR